MSSSIKNLIKEYIERPQYKKYWHRAIIKRAWKNIFPHMKGQIKELGIKNKNLYITLESLILAHELRRTTHIVLQRIKQELERLGHDSSMIKQLVFV